MKHLLPISIIFSMLQDYSLDYYYVHKHTSWAALTLMEYFSTNIDVMCHAQ